MALLWRHLLFPLFIFLSANYVSVIGVSRSASKQLMSTLMTLASANGILPEIKSVLDSAATVDEKMTVSQLLGLPYFAQNQVSDPYFLFKQPAHQSISNSVPNYSNSVKQIAQSESQVLPSVLCSSQNELESLVQNKLAQLNSPALQNSVAAQSYFEACQNTILQPNNQASYNNLPAIPTLLQNYDLPSQNLQPTESTLSCPDLIALTPTSNLKTISVSQCDKPLGIEVSLPSLTVEVPVPSSGTLSVEPKSNSMPPIILIAPSSPVIPPRRNALLPLLLLSLLGDSNGFNNNGGVRRGYCNYGCGNCGCCCGGNYCCCGNNCDCGYFDYGPGLEDLCDDPAGAEPLYPIYVPEDNPFEDGPIYDEDGCYYYYRCK